MTFSYICENFEFTTMFAYSIHLIGHPMPQHMPKKPKPQSNLFIPSHLQTYPKKKKKFQATYTQNPPFTKTPARPPTYLMRRTRTVFQVPASIYKNKLRLFGHTYHWLSSQHIYDSFILRN